MATKLDKTIKRELDMDGQAYRRDLSGGNQDDAEGLSEGTRDDVEGVVGRWFGGRSERERRNSSRETEYLKAGRWTVGLTFEPFADAFRHSPRRPRTVALASLALVPLVAGGFALQSRVTNDGAHLFDQVFARVSDQFVDTISASSLYEKAAQGLVHELNDPYTELLPPKKSDEFQRRTGGRYGGIGMEIGDLGNSIVVVHIFPHTPAEEAGVMEGDHIINVDSASTRGWKLNNVSDSLLGRPGTKVSVKFMRPSVPEPISFRFTRAIIHVPAIPYAIMLDGKIAYVPLGVFNEDAADDLVAELHRLVDQNGAKSVILDLRATLAAFSQALEMSNLFIPKEGRKS